MASITYDKACCVYPGADKLAVDSLNLDIDDGEFVVLVGPSGSGKSTLCRTINRLEPIDGGEILVEGQVLPAEGKDLARLRADVGMVFQSFNLFAHKTILENVTLGPIKVRKQGKAEAEKRGLTIVEWFADEGISGKAIANLSTAELSHPAPVFHGDTLYAETEVLEKRESKSKPDRGTVNVHTRVFNQDGTLVAEFKRLVLVPRKNPGSAA